MENAEAEQFAAGVAAEAEAQNHNAQAISEPWVYSFTQLALFRLCPRKWYWRYVANIPEPPDERMAYSSLLVHGALESWLKAPPFQWDWDWLAAWAKFTEQFPTTKLDLEPAQQALTQYAIYHPNLDGEVQLVEEKTYADIAGHRFVSKPDFVLLRAPASRWTVDFKFSMSDWAPKPLLPYDDQLLGQATTHRADGFIRVHLRWGAAKPKGPKSLHLTVEEQPVDPVLASEWTDDTLRTIEAIETMRAMVRGGWTKHTGSCHAFGRPCEYMDKCKLGLGLINQPLTLVQQGVNMVAGMEANI